MALGASVPPGIAAGPSPGIAAASIATGRPPIDPRNQRPNPAPAARRMVRRETTVGSVRLVPWDSLMLAPVTMDRARPHRPARAQATGRRVSASMKRPRDPSGRLRAKYLECPRPEEDFLREPSDSDSPASAQPSWSAYPRPRAAPGRATCLSASGTPRGYVGADARTVNGRALAQLRRQGADALATSRSSPPTVPGQGRSSSKVGRHEATSMRVPARAGAPATVTSSRSPATGAGAGDSRLVRLLRAYRRDSRGSICRRCLAPRGLVRGRSAAPPGERRMRDSA